MTLSGWLDALKADAHRASCAEDQFRREIAARTKELERQRAFAFRRLNLMVAIAEAIASADSEEIAVAAANATLRARLGWSSDSEARAEVLPRFSPVAQAMFARLTPEDAQADKPDAPDVGEALSAFESWYAATHPVPFWVLFENMMPETPVVDF